MMIENTKTLLVIWLVVMVAQVQVGECAFKILYGDAIDTWKKNDYKYLVYLFEGSVCTGSWVGKDKVVTAAHCTTFATPPKKAMFQRATADSKDTETIEIRGSVDHPDYLKLKSETDGNPRYSVDIAMITLKSAPKTSKDISTLNISYKDLPEFEKPIIIIGYGLDEKKQSGNLKKGQALFSECPPQIKHDALCADPDPQFRNQMTASGDSGGPMLWKRTLRTEAIGVIGGGSGTQQFIVAASFKKNEKFMKTNL